MIELLVLAEAGLALPQPAQSANYGVSAACGHDYVQNVIKIDGDVNFPAAVTVPQIAAMPGQQTLNITYLNHLGVAQPHSETGPSLWTVLSTAAGGIKVPRQVLALLGHEGFCGRTHAGHPTQLFVRASRRRGASDECTLSGRTQQNQTP